MPTEPSPKRTIAFFDGQNLFFCAKAAYGHIFPKYDPLLLAQKVCSNKHWPLEWVYFYSGVPDPANNT